MQNIQARDIKLITDKLPTNSDILSGVKFVINERFYHTKAKSENYFETVDHVLTLWHKAGIPTVCKKWVSSSITKKINEYKVEVKRVKRKTIPNTEAILGELFDIAKCKCFKNIEIEKFSQSQCKCAIEYRIPDYAFSFYVDQKSVRKLLLPSPNGNDDDINGSVALVANDLSLVSISDDGGEASREAESDPYESRNTISLSGSESGIGDSLAANAHSSDDADNSATDPDYNPMESHDAVAYNTLNLREFDLTHVVQICDAKSVSERAGAAIVSATFSSAFNKFQGNEAAAVVVQHQTFRNHTNRVRKGVVAENNKKVSGMSCFQFDGKICDASTIRANGNGIVLAKVDYYVAVKQPGDEFVAALQVESGSAYNIFNAFRMHFEENNISLSNLVAISSDGAPVNTGVQNGVIRRFEEYIDRPLQWVICLLHLNELVFQRLLAFLDPSSCSPEDFSSYFGHQLKNCENLQLKKFRAIKLEKNCLPKDFEEWDLTNDQKYLIDMALAVNAGEIPANLAKKKPGKMHKARWVTTMSRTLRVYVSYEKPPETIDILAEYIVKIYIPVLLAIKNQPSHIHGSRHLYLLASLCKMHFDKPKYAAAGVYGELVHVINNNCYYANHENILVAMVTDNNHEIRKEAYQNLIIASLITGQGASGNVRRFTKPKSINFNCSHYSKMISMKVDEITVPPVLRSLTREDLQDYQNSHDIIELENIPCHTQAIEQHIQITAHQARRTPNVQLQQGAIINTANYRKNLSKPQPKK